MHSTSIRLSRIASRENPALLTPEVQLDLEDEGVSVEDQDARYQSRIIMAVERNFVELDRRVRLCPLFVLMVLGWVFVCVTHLFVAKAASLQACAGVPCLCPTTTIACK